MLSELPKLFDKNFVIAYFLPSAGFVTVTQFLFTYIGKTKPLFNFSEESVLKEVTLFGLISLLAAIILSLTNRSLVRFMEGYWSFTIFQRLFDLKKRLNWLELQRYKKLINERTQLNAKRDKLNDEERKAFENEYRMQINRIEERLANRFPNKETLILPTSFGNTYRAFETYAQAMYGIDAIPGWYRLLAVIPQSYIDLMNAARARVDFWVNLWFLSIVVAFEYLILAFWHIRASDFWSVFSQETLWWIPLVALLISYLSFSFATNAVAIWGNWVKAAFDLYLPELRKKLEFPTPKTKDEETRMWKGFNVAALYRHADSLPEKKRESQENNSGAEGKGLDLSKIEAVERLLIINTAQKMMQEDFNTALELLKQNAGAKIEKDTENK